MASGDIGARLRFLKTENGFNECAATVELRHFLWVGQLGDFSVKRLLLTVRQGARALLVRTRADARLRALQKAAPGT